MIIIILNAVLIHVLACTSMELGGEGRVYMHALG